jgi:hypothetical protein
MMLAREVLRNPKKRTSGSVRSLIFAQAARRGKTLASNEVVDLKRKSASLANFDDCEMIVF